MTTQCNDYTSITRGFLSLLIRHHGQESSYNRRHEETLRFFSIGLL